MLANVVLSFRSSLFSFPVCSKQLQEYLEPKTVNAEKFSRGAGSQIRVSFSLWKFDFLRVIMAESWWTVYGRDGMWCFNSTGENIIIFCNFLWVADNSKSCCWSLGVWWIRARLNFSISSKYLMTPPKSVVSRFPNTFRLTVGPSFPISRLVLC